MSILTQKVTDSEGFLFDFSISICSIFLRRSHIFTQVSHMQPNRLQRYKKNLEYTNLSMILQKICKF